MQEIKNGIDRTHLILNETNHNYQKDDVGSEDHTEILRD